jgi:hypothetical protein
LSGGTGTNEFIMVTIAQFASGETVTGGSGADTITFGAAGSISFVGRTVTAVETLALTAGDATNVVTLVQGTGIVTVSGLDTAANTLTLRKATTSFEAAAEAAAGDVDVAGEWFLDSTDADDAVLTYYDETLGAVVVVTLVGAETGANTTAAVSGGNLVVTLA